MTIGQESALKERLKKGTITWIIDCTGSLWAIKQLFDFQETTALCRNNTDVFNKSVNTIIKSSAYGLW